MPLTFKSVNYCGYGIYNDVRKRIKYYRSDFADALNYRVVPSTIFIFFANLLPAIAFAQDMFDKTDHLYGVNETLLASAIGGIVFGLFSGQPLCIVGVTGPVVIFTYTVYEIMTPRGTQFFPFMCWIYLWSMIFHFGIALANWVSYLRIISQYSCDVFGFFICVVYLQKGVQLLNNQFREISLASGYCSTMIAILMVLFGVGSAVFGKELHYFNRHARKVFVDYGVPVAVIFFAGFIHFGGGLDATEIARLPITKSFHPTYSGVDRAHGWFIHFWPPTYISVGDVFLAIPFAILLTILFYFDHNVSSLICQLKEYPLKKPPSFHWDFALLGFTTGLSGILGIPAPNGLIPQAPLHTDSLVIQNHKGENVSVVEQRVTNTLQGVLTVVMMSRPFLVVLGLVPQAVLSGLFFIMGITGLHGNIITNRIRYLFMDKEYIKSDPHCPQVFRDIDQLQDKRGFYLYLFLQLVAFGAEFGITLTKGAIGFPAVLVAFALCAKWIWPLIISKESLSQLDGDVAEPFIFESLLVVDNEKKASKQPRADVESIKQGQSPANSHHD